MSRTQESTSSSLILRKIPNFLPMACMCIRMSEYDPSQNKGTQTNLCQDLALAHLKAATVPEASSQRFIICAGQVSSQQISDVMRKSLPEVAERTPVGAPGGNPLSDGAYDCSSEKAKSVLGIKFKSLEETFIDLGRQLLELEDKEKA